MAAYNDETLLCDLCGNPLEPYAHYVVRIDVFSDPATPPLDTEADSESAAASMADLIKQMKDRSAEDLQDEVHRRFEYRVCGKCQKIFLANPLGKPREQKPGMN